MAGFRRRLGWLLAHLTWNDGEPDPRVLQVGFTALLAGVVLLRIAGGARSSRSRGRSPASCSPWPAPWS